MDNGHIKCTSGQILFKCPPCYIFESCCFADGIMGPGQYPDSPTRVREQLFPNNL